MSNGNQRTEPPEQHAPDLLNPPVRHIEFLSKQPVQVAIANWINSCGRQDQMSIHEIVDACWMLEPVVSYLTTIPTTPSGESALSTNWYRKQLIKMYIAQSLRHYIDAVVIESVKD